ncbi:MBL fold metallo-hydrolase [Jeotgalibacillus sp. ET6]|uniref:MBL fold metallo-hydrolase n=1 Tax=Jeotgalibacillus sp. ET6 TaxID=3037260 RepID=UPI0024187300|nr:MBL fold metallo-hydrolase [Jeotgalibacillus sp. ET6]MDG5472345.1 MBL fold metallo-hydrolase [Jeotgalibacillus sp. ET6]
MKKYKNQIPTNMNMGWKSLLSMVKDSVKGIADQRPSKSISATSFKQDKTLPPSDVSRVTWFGHSAFYMEIEGKRVLVDPMLGSRPSPFSWAGTKRYEREVPVKPEHFSEVDAIILSHDHYDHLDRDSIIQLQTKTKRFIVPLGVGKRLTKWGVSHEKITELGWWDELQWEGLKLVCTPARHFSGRGLFDRNSTLWCSWVILGDETKIFYSGDSGYGPHFREIGESYGPFDLTLLECGQYDERWSAIHMRPEETVQAHLDVRGRVLIPVHWGAFTLAFHSWTDPVERVTKAAISHNIIISTPKMGESVLIQSENYPSFEWWR